MVSNAAPKQPQRVVFQCEYGQFQPGYRKLLWILVVCGVLLIPIGIFRNDGWEFGGRPLEPWVATLVIEGTAFAALLLAGIMVAAARQRRKSPQRVAVTDAALLVPKGLFSNCEVTYPFIEVNLKVFDAGFVKQLQIRHGRKKRLLTSAMFPTDAAFDEFVSHLPL